MGGWREFSLGLFHVPLISSLDTTGKNSLVSISCCYLVYDADK